MTLNDSAFLVMARNFAFNLQEQPVSVRTKIMNAYEQALNHQPDEKTLSALQTLYEKALAKFKNDSAASCEMIGLMNENNNPETAAMVIVTNAIFNLDEFVTRN